MCELPNDFHGSGDLLPSVHASHEYTEEIEKGLSIPLAIGSAALRLSQERHENPLDAPMYEVIGRFLPAFAAHQQLSSGTPYETKAERRSDKIKLIEFGHAIKELLGSCKSGTSFSSVQHTLFANLLPLLLPNHTQEAIKLIGMECHGMRSEIAAETMLAKSGMDYDLPSVEDDLRGIDFLVDGMGIDIKSSERLARETNDDARRNGHNRTSAIWTHLRPNDFEDRIIPTDRKLAAASRSFIYDVKRSLASRKSGAA